MKQELVIIAAAMRDLRGIREYIAEESPQQAQVFAADIAWIGREIGKPVCLFSNMIDSNEPFQS